MLRLLLLLVAIKTTRIHAFNQYFDYGNKTIHVCVNAKAGSTSIALEMYEALSNTTYPKSCNDKRLWAQEFSCGFDDIPSFHRHERQPRNIDYALLINRHPVHRIVSAWRSKVRSNLCTAPGDRNIDKHDRDGLYKRWNTAFMSFSQFVLEKLDDNNAHWNPQFDLCLETDYYDDVVDLEKIDSISFTPLSNVLGVPFQMKHEHSSKAIVTTRKLKIVKGKMKKTLHHIYKYYSDDFEQYNFSKSITEHATYLENEFSQYDRSCFYREV